MNAPVEIAGYDPGWPATFAALRDQITGALGPLAQRIEHVGSTAVPGLPAKPIIDLDVVIATRADLPEVIARLAALGYRHEGDLGIPGREAFTSLGAAPAHHLYVCTADSRELASHLTFRDYLRTHPGQASAYAELKRSLAARYRSDRDAYGRGKTAFIEQALATAAEPHPTRPIPVLLITGVVGVGKTTVTGEASWLLRQAGIPHAMTDLAVIGGCWPAPPGDEPLETVKSRIRAREVGRDPQWYLDAAEYLTGRLEDARAEDHVVSNHDRAAHETAAEVLRVAGWLPAG